MSTSMKIEYCLLHYVPNVGGDRSVPVAAMFIPPVDEETGIFMMSIAPNWQAMVRLVDPDGDLEMLGAILAEIREKVYSKSERSEMVRQLEDSFSNVIQISQRRKCPVSPTLESIEAFARELFGQTSIAPAASLSMLLNTKCEAMR